MLLQGQQQVLNPMSKYLLNPQLKKPHHLWSDSRPHENLGMPWLGCVCLAQRPVARSRWRGKAARLSSPVVFPTHVLTAASCVCLRSFLSQRWLLCGWCLIAPGSSWSVHWLRHHCWHRAPPYQIAEEFVKAVACCPASLKVQILIVSTVGFHKWNPVGEKHVSLCLQCVRKSSCVHYLIFLSSGCFQGR